MYLFCAGWGQAGGDGPGAVPRTLLLQGAGSADGQPGPRLQGAHMSGRSQQVTPAPSYHPSPLQDSMMYMSSPSSSVCGYSSGTFCFTPLFSPISKNCHCIFLIYLHLCPVIGPSLQAGPTGGGHYLHQGGSGDPGLGGFGSA